MVRFRRGWAQQIDSEKMTNHSPVVSSLLEPVLLYLLRRSSSHGYNLLNNLSEFGMGTIHPSVVYRTLRELEHLGCVTSEWDIHQTQGPPRRVYKLTNLGEEVFAYWKNEFVFIKKIIDKVLE